MGEAGEQGQSEGVPKAALKAGGSGEQVGEDGIAAEGKEGCCQKVGARQEVEQEVEEGQQEQAPPAAVEHHGGGEDVFDEGRIRLQEVGRKQAPCPAESEDEAGAESAKVLHGLPAEHSHQGQGTEGGGAEDPGVGRAVLPRALQGAVNIISQVIMRQEASARMPGIGDEAHGRPIAEQGEHAADGATAHPAEEKAAGGNEVARRNGLKGVTEKADVTRIESEQVALHHHPQQEEADHTPQHAREGAQTPMLAAAPPITGKGKGHGNTHHKDKQRHHQIPAGKAFPPIRMAELLDHLRRQGIPEAGLQQVQQKGSPAGQQGHVKPA